MSTNANARSTAPSTTTDVLVVGAGPSGLTTAVLAARLGARVRVVDHDPGLMDQSRAAIVHTRTLELWDKLGLAERAVDDGQRLTATRMWSNGRVLTEIPLRGPVVGETPFPFALGYEQWKTQKLLAEELAAVAGPGAVEWDTALAGLRQDGERVTAELHRGDGTVEHATARWLVAADGARSTARTLLDVPFPGETYGQIGFLADVDMEPGFPLPDNRLSIAVAPVGDVGILRMQKGRSPYRLFGTITEGLLAASEAQRDDIGVADVQRWFDEQFRMPARITRCDWYLVYRLHKRTAPRFRTGRCFLVGDAAHVHPPSGGQGANLSMGDGYNLGWKLGMVATGRARPDLLDTYDAERRPVARTISAGSDRGFRLEASSPAARRARQVLLPAALRVLDRVPPVRDRMAKLTAQTWIRYPHSPAVHGDGAAARARPGDRAPDAAVVDGPRTRHLFDDLRGVGHHLLVLEGVEPVADFDVAVDGARAVVGSYPIDCRVHAFPAGQDEVHAAYAVTGPCAVLVRPDGHIAYRGPLSDLRSLISYLDSWYPRSAADDGRSPDPAPATARPPADGDAPAVDTSTPDVAGVRPAGVR